jgi:hypothetical protein
MRNQNTTHSSSAPAEELDLMVHDMDSAETETRVQGVLQKLPAIQAVRIIQRGVWIRYNPLGISPDEICTAIRQSGFRASIFQDSKTGRTGVSSQ